MVTFQFQQVHKAFDQKVIFDSLDLVIKEGEHWLFKGPSGMGKTTLFNLILGFDQPDSGVISFEEQVFSTDVILSLRKKLAYVPQSIHLGQGTVYSIFEDIMSFQANMHLTNWINEFQDLLPKFGLDEATGDRDFNVLSGGEQRRIAIILSILLHRKIFLLDEPTVALDPKTKQKIIQYFSERSDITLLVISHDSDWDNGHFLIFNLAS